MSSVLVSGITKIILGSSAVALGVGGAMSGFIFGGESKEHPSTEIKTVSSNNENEEILSEDIIEESPTEVSDSFEDTQIEAEEEIKDSKPQVVEEEKQVIPVKPECKLYKLKSESTGEFIATNKEELKKEAKAGDYKGIEDACEKAEGKEIFVSNKYKSGWKYYDADQKRTDLKNKFSKYLQKIKVR
ncbi:hypothetical protein HF1_06320 [Mycoplasma haemofelis str. Langford 1]|uniref:Uncharacterized protein n=1 Tax=Mycoplasma haemofelis (strain Langford 1) TaxID=941640 RepID=E8ZHL9_MYCHL|nr:hypothetical protein [Mycoplasma haemofelis]CBY92640.1 hypothetical protein HF1_06320 [Mycoplasma haemofelis str. Langford 1]